ncbi:ABC-ATPase domain-containing protein [bacterium]|nr:ABC-ATPase domain-containing protein [bacterium]
MKGQERLRNILKRINGKGYKSYKELKDTYDFGNFTLIIDHVQGDTFALPSRIRIRMPQKIACFPSYTYRTRSREIAVRDYITRLFHLASKKYTAGCRGSGKGGLITIEKPVQEILQRTSAFINDEFVEIRFAMGLPAFGRKIAGLHADEMFFVELPGIIEKCLFFCNLDAGRLTRHIEISEDADYLRSKLKELKLITFIEDGSCLPRLSGIDPRPYGGNNMIPFMSPEKFRISIELPNSGEITGMGIPEGITLIVGGGYHGKSTLLNAIELGVYNHIPGDGRELVVTVDDAFKIRAEDGRRVEKVDISPFINNLPFNADTKRFDTEDASGSTSQSANIIEALEAGSSCLLIDEDTSATNFMIRDHRMQELVSKENEPITPFIDKARYLYEEYNVSTLLVIGGSGDYFDIADNVLCMDEYKPVDVTESAKHIAEKYRSQRTREGGSGFGHMNSRYPKAKSFDPSRGNKRVKIGVSGINGINFGRNFIDLSAIEQIIDISQTRALGMAILYSIKYMKTGKTLREVIDEVIRDIDENGLDILDTRLSGEYALFRKFELAAAINRLRSLKIR